jgi:hypothetical protein
MKTLDDFIAFYSAIPAEQWCEGAYMDDVGRRCALGHCCVLHDGGLLDTFTPDIQRLAELMHCTGELAGVNDGKHPKYPQPHPKLRVLAFLNDLKAERTNQL